jgi:hypothetical protein
MPDTCVATTDAVDADLNANCDGPPTDASVWYELTAAADGGIVVDARTPATRRARSLPPVAGAPETGGLRTGAAGWSAVAGETYAILVFNDQFDDQFDGSGSGGTPRAAGLVRHVSS